MKKLTQEEFIEKAIKVHENLYDYSKINYVNMKTEIEIFCKTHGYFWQNPHSHLQGRGCYKCGRDITGNNKRKSLEKFIIDAEKIHDKEYNYLLVNYKNSKTKIKIICKIHGVFEQTPSHHLRGQKCPICMNGTENNSIRITFESFIIKAEMIHNYKYKYIYKKLKNMHESIKIVCPIHEEFEQEINAHLNGSGCPNCKIDKLKILYTKSLEQFILDAKKIHGNKYDYSEVDYINSKIKIKIICSTHGIFKQQPYNHLLGNGCPYCNESYGERKINNYLKLNNYYYKRQYRFNDCKDKNPLPFDFVIFEDKEKNKLKYLIEYDGELHYQIIEYFGGKKEYEKIRYRDNIKNVYCNTNKIELIRIPYWNYYDINNILNSILTK